MAEEHDHSEPRASDAGSPITPDTDPAGSANAAPDNLAATVDAGVDRILRAFEEKLKYDESKQQVIDRQHDELVVHRGDLVAQAARPFIYGMIHHHAEIGKLLVAVRNDSAAAMSSAKVCELFESLLEDIEEVLGENGVAAYRAEVSEPFDPARQTVVGKALSTTDEERSGTVAACLGPGFERDGSVLVKARVSAYRYEPSPSGSSHV